MALTTAEESKVKAMLAEATAAADTQAQNCIDNRQTLTGQLVTLRAKVSGEMLVKVNTELASTVK